MEDKILGMILSQQQEGPPSQDDMESFLQQISGLNAPVEEEKHDSKKDTVSLEKMLGLDTPAFGAKGKQFVLE